MALPRLAVLSVLSAASSPCPDLNLIHYNVLSTDKNAGQKKRLLPGAGGGYPRSFKKVTLKNYETSQKELYY